MADIRINALATTATTPASDDYLALDGTAQGTRKILATNIANNVTDVILGSSGPSVKSTLSARAPRQGLVFDGTAGATVTVPSIGTGDFTIAAWAKSDNSVDYQTIIGGGSNSLSFRTVNGGGVTRLLFSLTEVADAPQSTVTVPPNKWNLLTLRRNGTNVYYGVNGIEDAAITNAGDFPQPFTYIGRQVTGTIWKGELVPYVYNRALSSSEVVALYEAGAPAGADYNTATTISTSFASGWTAAGGATLGATASIPAGGTVYIAGVLNAGKKMRFTVTVDSLSAGAVQYYNGSAYVTFATATGTYTVEYTAGSVVNQIIFAAVGGNAVLSSPNVARIGLLLAPDAYQAGNGLVWTDMSGNGTQIVLPTFGVSWNVPSTGATRVRGTTSTNGNQALLGASYSVNANVNILRVRARARTGTPTVKLGVSSGGAEIVAAVALNQYWKVLTILSDTTGNAVPLWANSNSTDIVEWDVEVEPLSF